MSIAFLIQFAASAVAVSALVGLAGWARISRPVPSLDDARARAILSEEFPGRPIDAVWLDADGGGALAKSGASALVLIRVGDGYAARQISWAQALATGLRDGRIRMDLADAGAPRATLALDHWPPRDIAA